MAVDKKGLYDAALILLGQRVLNGIGEERGPRYDLDAVYDLGAVDYCLEIVRPTFASLTKKLTTSTASAEHDLDNVFDLPSDFVTKVGVYSDAKLDQMIERYIIEDRTLACEYATVYLRYTSNARALTSWSPSFVRVVSAYLAREIAIKVAPKRYSEVDELFTDRVEVARTLEGEKEPAKRAAGSTVTLSNDWRHVYNDALLIMGLDQITANDDDSNRRSKLDTVVDAGVVKYLLEDVGWTFALDSVKIQYDPSKETDFGYRYVFAKPADLHRIDGLYTDEYMNYPLKLYKDERGNFYCDYTEIYLSYVSTDWLINPASWPSFFRRLVGARMAQEAAPSLKGEGADPDRADAVFEDRKSSAESNDAMQAPPRLISQGTWTRARNSPYRRGTRGRP